MITEKLLNVQASFTAFLQNAQLIGTYIANNWTKLISDGIGYVVTVFQNLGTNIWELGKAVIAFISDPTQGFQFNWTGLTEGFKATADQLPELIKPAFVSLQEEIDAKTKAIGEKELARSMEMAEKAKKEAEAIKRGVLAPDKLPTAEAVKPAELKLASASQVGSQEAFSARAQVNAFRPTNASNGQKVQTDLLAEAKKQTALQAAIAAANRNAPPAKTQFAL